MRRRRGHRFAIVGDRSSVTVGDGASDSLHRRPKRHLPTRRPWAGSYSCSYSDRIFPKPCQVELVGDGRPPLRTLSGRLLRSVVAPLGLTLLCAELDFRALQCAGRRLARALIFRAAHGHRQLRPSPLNPHPVTNNWGSFWRAGASRSSPRRSSRPCHLLPSAVAAVAAVAAAKTAAAVGGSAESAHGCRAEAPTFLRPHAVQAPPSPALPCPPRSHLQMRASLRACGRASKTIKLPLH